MSRRNRTIPLHSKGVPPSGISRAPISEPKSTIGFPGASHSDFRGNNLEGDYSLSGSRMQASHSADVEGRLAAQYDDIQILLVDNQRFAAIHVALRQELEVALHDLRKTENGARALHEKKDCETKVLLEKSAKMESEIQAVDATRSELIRMDTDIRELTAARLDLSTKAQMMTHELGRVTSDLRRIPAIQSEIEGLRHELKHLRLSIENQKKSYAQSIEHGKVMESKLVSLAKEIEKLSDAEKRAQSSSLVVNPGLSFNVNYSYPESVYSGKPPYQPHHGVTSTNTVQSGAGSEAQPQDVPGPVSWGYYDSHRMQGPG